MSQSNRPKPSLLQTPCHVVLITTALVTVTVATVIGAGCMTPAPSLSPAAVTPAAASASAAATKQIPANAAPSTGQVSLTQAQGGNRSWFVLVRWQESSAAPKELPSAEGNDADPTAQPISIEFSSDPEAASGVASGYSDCNRFSGLYEKLASGVRFGDLASARMACNPARMELEAAFLGAPKSPLTTVGMQPSASGKQDRQVIWKTISGILLQFAERSLPPHGQAH